MFLRASSISLINSIVIVESIVQIDPLSPYSLSFDMPTIKDILNPCGFCWMCHLFSNMSPSISINLFVIKLKIHQNKLFHSFRYRDIWAWMPIRKTFTYYLLENVFFGNLAALLYLSFSRFVSILWIVEQEILLNMQTHYPENFKYL